LIRRGEELILKGEYTTSITRNREGPLRRAIAVEESTCDLSLLISRVDEYDHMLSAATDHDGDETVLAGSDRHWILIEHNARTDRLPKEVSSSLRRGNLNMTVRHPSLHLESCGKWLKLNEPHLGARELYLNRVYLSSIHVEYLKLGLGPPLSGDIDSGSDEKGA
jgi:hypothetical protein